ncbi:MAG: 1-deoxy-D-xylulose-5-phosphate synthase [Candidatus Cloacimonetes bacterium]|nr:1-deoxy-D-xylulose-5-phosphate synthase [Candidatus Cloacimonadota bacterium]
MTTKSDEYKLLDTIKKPADVRNLRFSQLRDLAMEVRHRIIEVTSKNGGHVAPSLGATDIAVALLKVFDPLKDRIVWDVGHQSYAYKILTGRNDRFDTLRQFGGISGFNNIFESKADAFGVGHSSTSISAALGIRVADELMQRDNRAIAVIGDGALTGGMSFEAINHAGHLGKNIIVVLNDNAYSISPNVGALQNYMASMLVSKSYNTLKEKIWDLSKNLPTKARRTFITGVQKIEESMMNILVPNIFFEDLGFKYVGPIDGHDIARMVRIFNKVRHNVVGPVLIHVVTQKGKGYRIAENDARHFHGVGPFDEKTGHSLGHKGVSYSKVFGDTVCRLAEKNERVVAITAAMTDGTGLTEFAGRFPNRFFDVGIAEQHAVTFAAGLAVRGAKPFLAIYSTFMQRALDQVIHDVALQKLPVVFCLDRGGLVGDDGATHHGAFDLSFMRLIPGLIVIAPRCSEELVAALEWAAGYTEGPVVIRYPRGLALHSKTPIPPIVPGKSEVVRPGKGIAFIGAGKAFGDAEAVCDLLLAAAPDLDPCLVNARFIKPLDTDLLEKLAQTCEHIVTIEDNALPGGFGESVSAYLANTSASVHCFGLPDEFVPHGTIDELKGMLGILPADIFSKLQPMLLPDTTP